MGKHEKGVDSHGLQSKLLLGRKRDLGRKLMYVVTVMGFLVLLRLLVVEHRWHWPAASSPSPSFSGTTSSIPLSPRHAAFPDFASSQSGASATPGLHTSPTIDSSTAVRKKNVKLLEFKPEDTFLPLKDEKQPGMAGSKDTNWFMSGLRGGPSGGQGETFDLPGDDPKGRVLCVRGNHRSDGTRNSYGLFRKAALPPNSTFLERTTFVADNYWDYHNAWHAISALANFVAWSMENQCLKPERLLLYHMGELVTSMGPWITHVLQAAYTKPTLPLVTTTTMMEANSSALCFERAVVQRRGLGGVEKRRINALFDMLRCRTRRYCGVEPRKPLPTASTEVLLYTRTGARSFANEAAVAEVVQKECAQVAGCNMRVLNSASLSFCQQVEAMSRTDVLITVHGAQLTNIMFMSPGSRVMEMFPKGWLEFAGIGQEIYKWHADWNRLVHEGSWRDPEGPDCPYPITETLKCLFFFKDRQVGLNATHLGNWARSVLGKFRATTQHETQEQGGEKSTQYCACDEEDRLSQQTLATKSISKQ